MYPSLGIVKSDTVIPAGETDDITPQIPSGPGTAFTFSSLPTDHPSLTILGVVNVTASASAIALIDFSPASQFTIGDTGVYSVTNTSGGAIGYDQPGFQQTVAASSTIENDGHVTVQGRDYAAGFVLYWGESLTNTGTIQVSSTSSAPTQTTVGVNAYNGAVINNSGTISVLATAGPVSQAIGVLLGSNLSSATLINTGSIVAGGTTPSGGQPPAAIKAFDVSNIITIINSGVISASGARAIDATGGPGGGIHLTNGTGGSIVGDVLMGLGPTGSQIQNAGSIRGDVHLDVYGDDLYDGRGGTLTGILYLGTGTDTVFLGDEGETVRSYPGGGTGFTKAVITGGAGVDAITGGAGIDIIDGGGGDDTLDGGGGVNTVSYASATGGVTVSLALHGARQNTVSAGSDLLTNIQNLTGSAFDDTLIGDGANNVIDGGAGDDILTGGLGADTFVYRPGYGKMTVTDFSHSQGDKIDLSAFTGLHTLDQVLTVSVQSGANAVISLGGGGTLTLSGVQLGALTASDFVFAHAKGGDFNGDGLGDLLWRNDSGDVGVWLAQNTGSGVSFVGQDLGPPSGTWQVQSVADFNGDGQADILWIDGRGEIGVWNGHTGSTPSFTGQDLGPLPGWHFQATGDINGDGRADILWRGDNGNVGIWTGQAGSGPVFSGQDFGFLAATWHLIGTGDFNGDGHADILWTNDNGDVGVWTSQATAGGGITFVGQNLGPTPLSWHAQAIGDFDGDGKADILWRNDNGEVGIWQSASTGTNVAFNGRDLGPLSGWTFQDLIDVNGDGRSDIVWRGDNGDVGIWYAQAGAFPSFTGQDFGYVAPNWHIQSQWLV